MSDPRPEDRDPAVGRADPGNVYNEEATGYEVDVDQAEAPDRTPEGQPAGGSNDEAREADRKGD